MRISKNSVRFGSKESKNKNNNGAPAANRLNRPSEAKILEEIRTRAYYRFLKRDGQPGNEWNDWFQAEREVKKQYQLA